MHPLISVDQLRFLIPKLEHQNDPYEWVNVATSQGNQAMKDRLASHFLKVNVDPADGSDGKKQTR